MSRWFRFYGETINHPKVLRLSDAMFRAWVTLLCIASDNEGILPKTADIALILRMKAHKVAEWLTVLTAAGLIDCGADGTFKPHNWDVRQYKSDVSTERVKQFRKRKRNVSATASETPPDNRYRTEQNSDANASGAGAPIDHRKRLFDEGLKKLAAMTGKGPDACRSFVGKCLKASSDDAIIVLGLIEEAERNQVVNPSAWIAARLKPVEIGNGNAQIRSNSSITESIRRDLLELERSESADLALPASSVLRISDRSVR